MTEDREGAILGLCLFVHTFNIGERKGGGYYNLGREFYRARRCPRVGRSGERPGVKREADCQSAIQQTTGAGGRGSSFR